MGSTRNQNPGSGGDVDLELELESKTGSYPEIPASVICVASVKTGVGQQRRWLRALLREWNIAMLAGISEG